MRRIAFTLLLSVALVGCSGDSPKHQVILPDDGAVRIPVSEIDDGAVHFYTVVHTGTNVNFLVRTDAKGNVHAHLDACYACYRYRKGFIVEDRKLVCIACRLEYDIGEEMWDYIGACAPISIHASVSRDHLVIDSAVLEKASRYF